MTPDSKTTPAVPAKNQETSIKSDAAEYSEGVNNVEKLKDKEEKVKLEKKDKLEPKKELKPDQYEIKATVKYNGEYYKKGQVCNLEKSIAEFFKKQGFID